MSRKAPARRHAGVSRPVRQERDRKVGHLDQGQRGDHGLTASSSGLPGLSQLDFAVDLVGEANAAERHRRAGGEGLIAFEPALHKGLADRLLDLALAVTPSALRNFRMLALKTSSFMATSFATVP